MTARPLRVLVTSASRHGSTAEIAMAVARALEEVRPELAAVVIPIEARPAPEPFDAVVLGSAVYFGRWLEPAREYATTHAAALRERPVWLFSSGPIGEPPFPPDEAYDAQPMMQVLGARGHATFAGRLDKSLLAFGERAMVTAMRAPLGDFRDWAAVRAWAADIAAALSVPVSVEQ